jgi:hypothetical protein
VWKLFLGWGRVAAAPPTPPPRLPAPAAPPPSARSSAGILAACFDAVASQSICECSASSGCSVCPGASSRQRSARQLGGFCRVGSRAHYFLRLHNRAGAPAPTATSFCSSTAGWCYFATATGATYSAASTACDNSGTKLVAFDTAAEQLEVEASGIISAIADVWIGLSYTASAWTWANGTALQATLLPSNSAPYAHW